MRILAPACTIFVFDAVRACMSLKYVLRVGKHVVGEVCFMGAFCKGKVFNVFRIPYHLLTSVFPAFLKCFHYSQT